LECGCSRGYEVEEDTNGSNAQVNVRDHLFRYAGLKPGMGCPMLPPRPPKPPPPRPPKPPPPPPGRIAGMPTHGYDAMCEAAMAVAFEVVALPLRDRRSRARTSGRRRKSSDLGIGKCAGEHQ
jgi:hypothetical protein